jgi:hypothetical protein
MPALPTSIVGSLPPPQWLALGDVDVAHLVRAELR